MKIFISAGAANENPSVYRIMCGAFHKSHRDSFAIQMRQFCARNIIIILSLSPSRCRSFLYYIFDKLKADLFLV